MADTTVSSSVARKSVPVQVRVKAHDSIAINIAENSLFKFRNISNEDPYVSGHSFSYCVLLPWYYSFANEWYPNVERSFSYWFTHVCYGSNSFQWFIFDS